MDITHNSKRIEWIDAMRGFTMVLVVFSHVELFGLNIFENDSAVNQLFMLIRMPLFFFVSGLIAYKANENWNLSHYIGCVKKKMRIQLIPTFFFGLLFALTVYCHKYNTSAAESITSMLFSPSKNGYWFTIVLLEMFLILYTVQFLLRKCPEKTRQILLTVTALALYSLFLFKLIGNNRITNIFCFQKLCRYFQFFIFGNIFSCYKDRLFKKIEKPYTIGAIILLFFGLYIISSQKEGPFASCLTRSNGTIFRISLELIHNVIRYLGLLIIISTFRHYNHFFSSSTHVGRGLQYIGRRTLDIYLLHFFLIPTIPQLGSFILQSNSVVVELSIVIFLSLLIITFCLIISNIIRISPFLAHYLFGVKWDKAHSNHKFNERT